MIRLITIILTLAIPIIGQTTEELLNKQFPQSQRIIHLPPDPFFKGRPYYLELVSDIPEDSVTSASLFIATEQSVRYLEFLLENYHGLYRFRYDPSKIIGNVLIYFFVLTTTDFGIYATPLTDAGKLDPVVIKPVDPVEYYNRR